MQTQEYKGQDVQLNMDYARELLVKIEQNEDMDGTRWFPGDVLLSEGHTSKELAYHLSLLSEAGFIRANVTTQEMPQVSRLTWNGHEFIADTGNPEVWAEVKEKVKSVAGAGLALVWELAKAALRKKLGL